MERENPQGKLNNLRYRLSRAREVQDNITTPGWINDRAPKAYKLRLDGDVMEMSGNLLRPGSGALVIKQKLGEVVILRLKEEYTQQTQQLMRDRLKTDSVVQLDGFFADIITEITSWNPEIRPFDFYKTLSEMSPQRMTKGIQDRILSETNSDDPEISKSARNVSLFINLKSIYSGVERFLSDNPDENDEIIQNAVAKIYESLPSFDGKTQVSLWIYNTALYASAEFVAGKENMPANWLFNKPGETLDKMHTHQQNSYYNNLLDSSLEDLMDEIAKIAGCSIASVKNYLIYLRYITFPEKSESIEDDVDRNKTECIAEEDDLKYQLDSLLLTRAERERRIIRLRFGLDNGEGMTLKEIGRVFGVNQERIRQIQVKVMRRLRHPSLSKRIKDYYPKDPPEQWYR